MAKTRTLFICSECGKEYSKWNGRCSECGSWNTIEEVTESIGNDRNINRNTSLKLKVSNVSDIEYTDDTRYDTGVGELNRVLGGGLVKGSLVLLSGEPGIGKSTLLLQICRFLAKDYSVLYISGEESERQIKLRADRLGVNAANLFLASGTSCDAAINTVTDRKPDIVIIDSVQTMQLEGISSTQGSLVQVRECTNAFMKMAKSLEIPVFIVGHVNKDGGIAGPKSLEHIVDTVLYFEGDKQLSYRILRAAKNRFGSTNEIGVFEMLDKGLAEVKNPSAMLLSGRPAGISGISILCTMEGSRPILAEIQVLVSKTGFGTPRRISNGFDYNRLCMILAVLEKRTGFMFGNFDVYVNIIGGMRIEEPAADLAIALALYSGLCDTAIPDNVVAFGEIGLGGEVRNISHVVERIREAARMGFERVIVPKSALKSLDKKENYGIKIAGVANLRQAFTVITASETQTQE